VVNSGAVGDGINVGAGSADFVMTTVAEGDTAPASCEVMNLCINVSKVHLSLSQRKWHRRVRGWYPELCTIRWPERRLLRCVSVRLRNKNTVWNWGERVSYKYASSKSLWVNIGMWVLEILCQSTNFHCRRGLTYDRANWFWCCCKSSTRWTIAPQIKQLTEAALVARDRTGFAGWRLISRSGAAFGRADYDDIFGSASAEIVFGRWSFISGSKRKHCCSKWRNWR